MLFESQELASKSKQVLSDIAKKKDAWIISCVRSIYPDKKIEDVAHKFEIKSYPGNLYRMEFEGNIVGELQISFDATVNI